MRNSKLHQASIVNAAPAVDHAMESGTSPSEADAEPLPHAGNHHQSIQPNRQSGNSPGSDDIEDYFPTATLPGGKWSKASKNRKPTVNKPVLPEPPKPLLPLDPKVTPSTDFIRDYIAYADRFEIPPRLHEIVAMAGTAAAVNGRVTINTGHRRIPFDFWVSVLTRSGGGKNTLLGVFRELLRLAGLEKLIHKESFGSASQIQEYFSKNPTGFFIWPEMAARSLS